MPTISFGGGSRKRRNVTILYGAIERYLQPRAMKEKTKIVVKYGKTTSNETIASTDKKYLLYAAGCFLEDYMTKDMQKTIRDRYLI